MVSKEYNWKQSLQPWELDRIVKASTVMLIIKE